MKRKKDIRQLNSPIAEGVDHVSARTRAAIVMVSVSLFAAACGTGSGGPSTASTSDRSIALGAIAPDFTLPSAGGADVSLSDFAGKKPVLLYFSMGPG